MNVLVIDAQGGGIGKQLVSKIKSAFPDLTVTAVGTNAMATSAMLKAGADQCATGENSVIVACKDADIIIGPIGIIAADSMIGEITPAIACHVAQSSAKKILIPFNTCNTYIAGIKDMNTAGLINAALDQLKNMI